MKPLKLEPCGTHRTIRGWTALVMLSVGLLAGCAGERAFREGRELIDAGQYPEGFAKVEEALGHEPRNAEYRIYFANRRESVIASLFAQAEKLRELGQLTEAEKVYQQVARLDPNHAPSKVSLEKLAVERRHRNRISEAEAALKVKEIDRASEIVRQILVENPQQREARNLEARISEAQAKTARLPTALAPAFRKPVSLEFREAPIRSVFEFLSKASGINFVYDRDIRPDLKTTIFVKNTPMDEAIRLIGVTSQLETRILNDNSILIYPNTPQKLKEYQPLSVRSFYLANADVKQVSNTLKTLLKVRDIVVNERLNLLIVRDTPEAIRLAEKLVALEDISEPEVMLEVEVVEVKRTRLLDLGIQWPSQLSLAPLVPSGSTLTFNQLKNLTGDTISASVGSVIVKAQKDNSDTNILANPRIRVKNREKARILIGDRVPVITSTSTSTGFVSESVNYVDVGLKLEVEPNIYLDDEVSIKVNLEVSSLVREITTKSGTLSYQIGTRNASTTLRLKDGETQVLAGLINDEDRRVANRVPGVGELPILNRLFGSQKDDVQKTEIVLSITPRLVRTIRRPDIANTEFEVGTEANVGTPAPMLSQTTGGPRGAGANAGGTPGSATVMPVPQPFTQSGTPAPTPPPVPGSATNGSGGQITPVQTQPPAIPAAGTGVETGASAFRINWNGPTQVRSGEQFSVTLTLTSQEPLSALPLLIGFDPGQVQVINVVEGDFLKQGAGQTVFSERVDPIAGRIFVGDVRQNGPVNGSGNVVVVNFKAIKSTPQTRIQLLSLTPTPMPANAAAPTAPDLVFAVN